MRQISAASIMLSEAQNSRLHDVAQWQALMALPDAALIAAWQDARAACATARAQGMGLQQALAWEGLLQGAAASRFGVARCRVVLAGQGPNPPP